MLRPILAGALVALFLGCGQSGVEDPGNPAPCICPTIPPQGVFEGTVQSIDANHEAAIHVDVVAGDTGLQVGQVVSALATAAVGEVTQGAHVLAIVSKDADERIELQVVVPGDGEIVCSDPPVRVTAAEATKIILSGDCEHQDVFLDD
jgi:hypothetical protein